MDYQEPNLFISYKYIEAKSPKELEKKMLQIQIDSKKPINFTPPSFVTNKWTTWYQHNWTKDIDPRQKQKMGQS